MRYCGVPWRKERGRQLPQCLIYSLRCQIYSFCSTGILNRIYMLIYMCCGQICQLWNWSLLPLARLTGSIILHLFKILFDDKECLTVFILILAFQSLSKAKDKHFQSCQLRLYQQSFWLRLYQQSCWVEQQTVWLLYSFYNSIQKIEQAMLQWFKKSFDQLEDSTWYYQNKSDEKIYDSTVYHINQQMKQQKREFLKKTIEKLGFKQEKDYDGKIVLKNNIPIKRSMTYREVEDLITRLKVSPKPQQKSKAGPHQPNIKKQIKSYLEGK